MSGRLIILPKKSYCPWNTKNVERVLKDEREHANAQEREQKRKQQDASRSRLLALKGKSAEEYVPPLGHVNLFRKEEKEHLERHQSETKKKGITPLHLGQSVKHSKEAFYLQKRGHEEVRGMSAKEERLKTKMDPMSEFHIPDNGISRARADASSVHESRVEEIVDLDTTTRDEMGKRIKRRHRHSSRDHSSESDSDSNTRTEKRDRRRRRELRKARKRHRTHRKEISESKPASENGDSLEELRRRRVEREERERERQDSLIRDSQRGHSSRYLDQFNPRLSRK